MSSFKSRFSLELRKSEATRIMGRYPDRVPIVVEIAPKSNLPDIDKHKFLVPVDITIGQFLQVIRKRITLQSSQGLFLFVNNTIPAMSLLIGEVYKNHKDDDGFLYFLLSGESVFG
jgi:GABA(A) receptor-associated protein